MARLGGFGFKLATELCDMNIYRARFKISAARITPYLVEKLFARHGTFAMRMEILQDSHFTAREYHGFGVALTFKIAYIDRDRGP